MHFTTDNGRREDALLLTSFSILLWLLAMYGLYEVLSFYYFDCYYYYCCYFAELYYFKLVDTTRFQLRISETRSCANNGVKIMSEPSRKM